MSSSGPLAAPGDDLTRQKSVRLYFLPVVPYGTDNYLVCPVCSRGLQVSDTQLRHVRSMSSATASFRTDQLSQARYMAQAERFWRQLGPAADDRTSWISQLHQLAQLHNQGVLS